MIRIVGVRFRKSGKVYYFDPEGFTVQKGDHVIVETARGVEYGSVVLGPKEIEESRVVSPLKPLIRVATPKDDETNLENQQKEKDAFGICLEKIAKHGLEMKLIDSEYTFDRNKLLFYFTADGRIDFRELVKDLASVFRTRIELRQIGVRDETKMIGGMAICGRPLCCHSYLADFAPVSIKMAKEQNLSLNPAKISGVCGRLMCCLKNEQEAYEYLNSTLPSVGTWVKTSDGYQGEVQSISVLKQLVKVVITKDGDEKEVREYPARELQFDSSHRNNASSSAPFMDELVDADELEQLEMMEEEDRQELAEDAEKAETQERPGNGRGGYKRNKGYNKGDYSRRDYNNRNEHSRRDYSRGDYNKSEHGRREFSRGDHNKNEHGKRDYGRGDYNKNDRSRNEYNKNYRNHKPKDYNPTIRRPNTHRKTPDHRDKNNNSEDA